MMIIWRMMNNCSFQPFSHYTIIQRQKVKVELLLGQGGGESVAKTTRFPMRVCVNFVFTFSLT